MLANDTFHIAILPGDGIGPEVMAPALAVQEPSGRPSVAALIANAESAGPDGISKASTVVDWPTKMGGEMTFATQTIEPGGRRFARCWPRRAQFNETVDRAPGAALPQSDL